VGLPAFFIFREFVQNQLCRSALFQGKRNRDRQATFGGRRPLFIFRKKRWLPTLLS
jgi:hypothetical protein